MSSLRRFTSAPKPAATTRLSAQKIIKAIEGAFTKAARSVKNVDGKCGAVEIDGRLDYESFRLPDDSPSILAAEEAIRSLGGNPVASDLQRRSGCQLDQCPGHSHGDPRLRAGEHPHARPNGSIVGSFTGRVKLLGNWRREERMKDARPLNRRLCVLLPAPIV